MAAQELESFKALDIESADYSPKDTKIGSLTPGNPEFSGTATKVIGTFSDRFRIYIIHLYSKSFCWLRKRMSQNSLDDFIDRFYDFILKLRDRVAPYPLSMCARKVF